MGKMKRKPVKTVKADASDSTLYIKVLKTELVELGMMAAVLTGVVWDENNLIGAPSEVIAMRSMILRNSARIMSYLAAHPPLQLQPVGLSSAQPPQQPQRLRKKMADGSGKSKPSNGRPALP